MKVRRQFHAPAGLLAGKDPSNHWIGSWLGPRASLKAVAKKKESVSGIESQSSILKSSHYTGWAEPV
jgi:hypothetical protein